MNSMPKMKALCAGEIRVKTWWGYSGLTGSAFRHWFLDCLMDKINRNDRRQWRPPDAGFSNETLPRCSTTEGLAAAHHPAAIRD